MKRPDAAKKSSGSRAKLWLTASAVGLAQAAGASAQTREHVDISIGGTVETDPFLVPGEDTMAAGATLVVEPTVFVEEDTATLSLQGFLRLQQYTNRYGTDASAGLNAGGMTRLDERTSLSSSLGLSSSRSAARDFYLSGEDLLDLPVDTFPGLQIPDVTAAGRRSRVNAIRANSSLNHALSPLDSVQLGLNVGYTDAEGGDNRVAGLQTAYRRQISERTSARGSVSLGHADYLDRIGGDGTFLTPMVGGEHQLSQNASLSAQVGATFTSIETSAGDRKKNVGLAASFDLCDRRQGRAVCASASRQAQPTAFGGLSTVSSLGISYGADLGERDRFSLAARYGRSKSILEDVLLQARDTTMYGLSSTYTRHMNDRLSAYISPSFTRVSSDDFGGGRSNFRAEAGIRLRIGARR